MIPILVIGGLSFDFISLLALLKTIIYKKAWPGIPGIGLFCYAIFFLSALMDCLDVGDFSNPYLLLATILIIFHIILHGLLFALKRKYGS